MTFTAADFERWRFNRDAVHFNGGREFFGWGHRCVDQPRLLVIDKYFRKDRSTQRSYLIDGKTPCTTLDEALAVLSKPPTISDDLLALLRGLSDEWIDADGRVPYLPLHDMGLMEFHHDKESRQFLMRRTDAGRAVIAEKAGRVMAKHDTVLLIAERRIQSILLDLQDQIGERVDQVSVDTRNFANCKTEIYLAESAAVVERRRAAITSHKGTET